MMLSTHNAAAQTTPDAMHTVEDVIVNIFDLITGIDYYANFIILYLIAGDSR